MELPSVAAVVAEIVAVTGADAVSVVDENVTVTPLGAPLAESVTGELNPPEVVNVRLTVFEYPFPTVTLDEPAVRPNEALPLLQFVASRWASIEPNPVASSYPVPALKPVTPGTLLLPLVMS